VTHAAAAGWFQSVFTHERRATGGDTLHSRCDGERPAFLVLGRLFTLVAREGDRLSSALNAQHDRGQHRIGEIEVSVVLPRSEIAGLLARASFESVRVARKAIRDVRDEAVSEVSMISADKEIDR